MPIEDFLANLIKVKVENAPPTSAEHYSVGTRRLGCDRHTYIVIQSNTKSVWKRIRKLQETVNRICSLISRIYNVWHF